jgi:hypothetical protein
MMRWPPIGPRQRIRWAIGKHKDLDRTWSVELDNRRYGKIRYLKSANDTLFFELLPLKGEPLDDGFINPDFWRNNELSIVFTNRITRERLSGYMVSPLWFEDGRYSISIRGLIASSRLDLRLSRCEQKKFRNWLGRQ